MSNFIVQPKTEGETKDCPNCGKPLIARLKVYKDYPNKIQWQNKDSTDAHYDKVGNCKGEETPVTPTPEPSPQPETPKSKLDDMTRSTVENETELFYNIKKCVEAKLKSLEVDPHPGMVWEMTNSIWTKYFGAKE